MNCDVTSLRRGDIPFSLVGGGVWCLEPPAGALDIFVHIAGRGSLQTEPSFFHSCGCLESPDGALCSVWAVLFCSCLPLLFENALPLSSQSCLLQPHAEV